jgi:peptidoglycan/LPS O-acetylase OafA/YrhL
MTITVLHSSDTALLTASPDRLAVLDGWRAVSILAVMAGHLLPLGLLLPGLNQATLGGGMAIFFTLSGFLITRFLFDRPEPAAFLIRRAFRIVPLAWVAMLLLALVEGASAPALTANFLFYANLPPQQLFTGGAHFWSLCVEVQFYLGIALLVALAGRRGLFILPALGLGVTAVRIALGQQVTMVTWVRLDEILAGASVALIYAGALGPGAKRALSRLNVYVVAALAFASCYWADMPIVYLRPYAIAATVAATLTACPRWLLFALQSRVAAYIAGISYALYVLHGMFLFAWPDGAGDVVVKSGQKLLWLAGIFGLAHLSTTTFERYFIGLAKRLTRPAPARVPVAL